MFSRAAPRRAPPRPGHRLVRGAAAFVLHLHVQRVHLLLRRRGGARRLRTNWIVVLYVGAIAAAARSSNFCVAAGSVL